MLNNFKECNINEKVQDDSQHFIVYLKLQISVLSWIQLSYKKYVTNILVIEHGICMKKS